MATVGNTNLTLSDWASRVDPDGKASVIAELLNSADTLLDDIVWREANGVQKHTGVVRTGLPSVYFRAINQGVPASKSTTAKVEEVMSSIEARSKVDIKLLELNGHDPNFRLSEDITFIESMKQTMLKHMIYGNPKKDPEAFVGLHMRYNDPSARTAKMVINADKTATGDTGYASIYLVVWGDNTVHGIFPKGSQAGLRQKDLGEKTVDDEYGNQFEAMVTRFNWDAGLHVKNWEGAGRIANISKAKLESGEIDLRKVLIQLTSIVKYKSMGRAVIYCPESVRTALRLQMLEKGNVNLTWDNKEGSEILRFDGIPVKALEALTYEEAAYDPNNEATEGTGRTAEDIAKADAEELAEEKKIKTSRA